MQWHRVFFLTFLLSVFPSLTWSDYTVHGILQARNLKWVTIPFPGDLPNPGIKTRSPTLQVDSLPAEPPGKPKNTGVVTYPFSRESSWPRNQTRVSCIAGGFFTIWATREAFWKRLGPVCMSRLEKQSVVSVAAIPQICAKQPPMIKSKWKFNLPFQKAHYLSLSNSTKNNNNKKK